MAQRQYPKTQIRREKLNQSTQTQEFVMMKGGKDSKYSSQSESVIVQFHHQINILFQDYQDNSALSIHELNLEKNRPQRLLTDSSFMVDTPTRFQ